MIARLAVHKPFLRTRHSCDFPGFPRFFQLIFWASHGWIWHSCNRWRSRTSFRFFQQDIHNFVWEKISLRRKTGRKMERLHWRCLEKSSAQCTAKTRAERVKIAEKAWLDGTVTSGYKSTMKIYDWSQARVCGGFSCWIISLVVLL